MNQLAGEDLRPPKIGLKQHQLPPLNYDYAALEPHIDSRTMVLHHDAHHGSYVEKLNAALAKFPDLRGFSALWLLRNLDKVPKEIRTAVHHNAGGHVNHSMFWRAMKPGAAGEPKSVLREALNRDFGSLAQFKKRFEEAGAKLFGSGWVWLVRTPKDGGTLEVITTAGHDHPMMQDHFPILLNDLWEHAYYLHYENRRPDYLKAWWALADWDEAARLFDLSENSAEHLWEAEGGHLIETKE
ncbi:MAG: superoxide dismutase [Burkholderiales bacterium]